MHRKALIRKMAIPAIIVLIISVALLIADVPIKNMRFKNHEKKLRAHLAELTQTYQTYVGNTARQITSIPVDADVVSSIQSKILQEAPHAKLYIWMSDLGGNFIFGAPSAIFSRLNQGFDNYSDKILSEGYYLDRNDFLLKLADLHERVDFSEFVPETISDEEDYYYRVYDASRRLKAEWERDYYDNTYMRPRILTLSAPVIDSNGAGIGDLYLIVDDAYNHQLYYNKRMVTGFLAGLMDTCRALASISGMFLWFLLPSWVYIDARQRDVKNPGLWAFLTLISGPFLVGWIIYLITRPQEMKAFTCPQCENELNGTKAFCPHCGFDLSGTFCPQCQYPIKPHWQYCPNCRAGLKELPEKKLEQLPEKSGGEKAE